MDNLHQVAYDLGANAEQRYYNDEVWRNQGSGYHEGMFEAEYGSQYGGRYNNVNEQLIYTSPTEGMSIGEANAYAGMGDRSMVRSTYETTGWDSTAKTGGVADIVTPANEAGLTPALTAEVGGGGPGWLYRLTGEHPYSMTQQVGAGATDAGAGAIEAPSATGGTQIDIIPRNNNTDAITPHQVTHYDTNGDPVSTGRASSVRGMGADTTPVRSGVGEPIEFNPGEAIKPGEARASSVRYGALGGGAMALGGDLWRMGNGEDISGLQVAADTGVGTAVGAGGALAFDALVASGRSVAGAGGIVGGALEGGMSLWDNANAYVNGDESGGQAAANVVVDTGIGVGAGMAGAAAGAALGSIIPGAGTAVGAGLGFVGGMVGSWAVHALAEHTGFTDWAKEGLGSVFEGAGELGGEAWDGAVDVGSDLIGGAADLGGAAVDGIGSVLGGAADLSGSIVDGIAGWF